MTHIVILMSFQTFSSIDYAIIHIAETDKKVKISPHTSMCYAINMCYVIAINKVSTDAMTLFLHSESAANHNTCLYGENFNFFMSLLCKL